MRMALQLREGARHGFNRQAEIVGDVGSAHWEIDGPVVSLALRQVEQEGGDFLHGALAAKQQHVRVGRSDARIIAAKIWQDKASSAGA